jgi:diguanylate cyclase (GGDEF)-like protein
MAWLCEKSQGPAVLDVVTGLPDGRAMREAYGSHKVGATHVAYLDLDLFGGINRELGDDAGDDALAVIGHRCRELPAADGIVFRVGGDEFALVAFGTQVQAAQTLRLLMDEIKKPIAGIGGRRLTATAGLVEVAVGEDAWSALGRAHERYIAVRRTGTDRADER